MHKRRLMPHPRSTLQRVCAGERSTHQAVHVRVRAGRVLHTRQNRRRRDGRHLRRLRLVAGAVAVQPFRQRLPAMDRRHLQHAVLLRQSRPAEHGEVPVSRRLLEHDVRGTVSGRRRQSVLWRRATGQCNCPVNRRGCSMCSPGWTDDDCSVAYTAPTNGQSAVMAKLTDMGQVHTVDGLHFRLTTIGEYHEFEMHPYVGGNAKMIRCNERFACVTFIALRLGDDTHGYATLSMYVTAELKLEFASYYGYIYIVWVRYSYFPL